MSRQRGTIMVVLVEEREVNCERGKLGMKEGNQARFRIPAFLLDF